MNHDLDSVIEMEVVGPWQNDCVDSFYPWQATPSLRKRWVAMASSSDCIKATAGALALARCATLDHRETAARDAVFCVREDLPIPPHVIIAIMLTGASPSAAYMAGYITYLFKKYAAQPRTSEASRAWDVLASIVRHPALSDAIDQLAASTGVSADFFDYLAFANPARPLGNHIPNNPWIFAQSVFRAPVRGKVPSDVLARFAYFLRTDFDRDEFARLSARPEYMLPAPMFDVMLCHPCLLRGHAPAFNPTNPHRGAISFYSGDDPVSHAWRFYNPLLLPPWVFEMIDMNSTPTLFACGALLGSTLIGANIHPAFSMFDFRALLGTHPALAMTLAYLGVAA